MFHCKRFDDFKPLSIFFKSVLPEEHQPKPVEFYGTPGITFNQPGKIVFQLLNSEFVRVEVKVLGKATIRSCISTDVASLFL